MDILTKEEFMLQKEAFMADLEDGELFIYPTDTIYGIGCDATNEIAVYNLRNIKKIPTRPVSIIAPSKEWIKEHFEVNDKASEWIDKLPGPYTLVLKCKNGCMPSNISDTGSIGVRIPDHWISSFVSEFGKPIVTTSANITGKSFMTNIDDLDTSIKKKTLFFIDEGDIQGKPSDIIFLDKNKVEIKER
ncbi:threonylcarbamoyl-AMP synthase [Candidatus Woesearchaeota archaeon]|nr:MAG: threonylcarbamoyl-AMP synthase [Candidatus Woesearchaeota archaeon]